MLLTALYSGTSFMGIPVCRKETYFEHFVLMIILLSLHFDGVRTAEEFAVLKITGADPGVVRVVRSNPLKWNKREYFDHIVYCEKKVLVKQ